MNENKMRIDFGRKSEREKEGHTHTHMNTNTYKNTLIQLVKGAIFILL